MTMQPAAAAIQASQGAAMIMWDDFTPKPTYHALRSTLAAARPRSSANRELRAFPSRIASQRVHTGACAHAGAPARPNRVHPGSANV
jgi:hypothetical protein